MAGFEVIIYGRFWVITEEQTALCLTTLLSSKKRHAIESMFTSGEQDELMWIAACIYLIILRRRRYHTNGPNQPTRVRIRSKLLVIYKC